MRPYGHISVCFSRFWGIGVRVGFGSRLRTGTEGSTNTENTPYGVFSVLVVFEGIGGGRVRKREKHQKCAHMGAFLRAVRVSGESGAGWAAACRTGGNCGVDAHRRYAT